MLSQMQDGDYTVYILSTQRDFRIAFYSIDNAPMNSKIIHIVLQHVVHEVEIILLYIR